MQTILVIARREVKRLRARFRGRSSPMVFAALALALIVGVLVFRQGPTLSKGIYRIGVSPDGPQISDQRFIVTEFTPERGVELLNGGAIDVFVRGQQALVGRSRRARVAAGALKRHLESQELDRIIAEEDLDDAFPLRIRVDTLPSPQTTAGLGDRSIGELIEAALGESGSDDVSLDATRALTDEEIRAQIAERSSSDLAQVDLEYNLGEDVLVPSLMTPTVPFAQVILSFLYVMPVAFFSVFFTGSFMEEKIDRRIAVLLSAPVTPLQIILGKMLPYGALGVVATIVMTAVMGGNVVLALAIFAPVMLFLFAVYLMVPMFYRTFKDTTFMSLLAITLTTSYLVFPAMFAGINDFAYMSPLTLATDMFRGEPFGVREYLFASLPMLLIFGISLYTGTRILNEQFLMGFRPLYIKISDAICLALGKRNLALAVGLLGAAMVPVVFMLQLAGLALSTNIPSRTGMYAILVFGVVIEEVAKSAGVASLLRQQRISSAAQALGLGLISALGFVLCEKAFLYLSLSVVTETPLSSAFYGGDQLWVPALAHCVFTGCVVLLAQQLGVKRYWLALLAGVGAHLVYNLMVLGVLL